MSDFQLTELFFTCLDLGQLDESKQKLENAADKSQVDRGMVP